MTLGIDYRHLLKKYMNHVLDQEGTYFLPSASGHSFTHPEVVVLEAIADELDGVHQSE